MLSLNATQVTVDFEFRHNPATFALNKTTPITSKATYLQDLLGFTEFVIVEATTIERNLTNMAETTKTAALPFEVRMTDLGSEYGTPTMRVDASMLKVRGDPTMDPALLKHRHRHGNSVQPHQSGLVKDLADWAQLDGPFPDLQPYAVDLWNNITHLFTGEKATKDTEPTQKEDDAEATSGDGGRRNL